LNEIDFVWEVGQSQPDDALWKQRFNELKTYKKKHGDCLVPQRYEQNPKLGRWVSVQRKEYKKLLNGENAFITEERIDQLNEIDFVWEVGKDQYKKKPKDDTLWKKRFNELVKYKKKHGDCLVPSRYEQNRKLGKWVNRQRQEYKKWLNGVNASITQERIDQLNEIDFVWEVGSVGRKDDTLWKQRLKELKAYKKKHGDCRVPYNYKQNAKLGS